MRAVVRSMSVTGTRRTWAVVAEWVNRTLCPRQLAVAGDEVGVLEAHVQPAPGRDDLGVADRVDHHGHRGKAPPPRSATLPAVIWTPHEQETFGSPISTSADWPAARVSGPISHSTVTARAAAGWVARIRAVSAGEQLGADGGAREYGALPGALVCNAVSVSPGARRDGRPAMRGCSARWPSASGSADRCSAGPRVVRPDCRTRGGRRSAR